MFAVGGAGLGMPFLGGRAWAGKSSHLPFLDVPLLAEDGSTVPVGISVDHPMEPDHYVSSLEVVVETDPVPNKGTFHFTPANGRAWVGFQMRSGRGGVVRAIMSCTRHGRFAGTKEFRVAEGGCGTSLEQVRRRRLGNPLVRVPRRVRRGDLIEVRTKIDHNSYTGLVEQDGTFVRERPAFYLTSLRVYMGVRKVSEFALTPAVSPDPLIRFSLRVTDVGPLRVIYENNEGQGWEHATPLTLSG